VLMALKLVLPLLLLVIMINSRMWDESSPNPEVFYWTALWMEIGAFFLLPSAMEIQGTRMTRIERIYADKTKKREFLSAKNRNIRGCLT